MNLELNLRFPTPEQVIVRLIEDDDHDESESSLERLMSGRVVEKPAVETR